MRHSLLTRIGLAGLLLIPAVLLLVSRSALADEIVVRDLSTGRTSSIRAHSITSETWTEVKYKERERGAEKSVPTIGVVEIHRSGKYPKAKSLRFATSELQLGNYLQAAAMLSAITGGGLKVDRKTGTRTYTSFSKNDPSARNKRPPWTSEYAHFLQAKALYMHGVSGKSLEHIEQAYLALVDQDVPRIDKRIRSGGFLNRFKEGNSRWYPEAMALAGKCLVQLDRPDEAAARFKTLEGKAVALDIGPRWIYEARMGQVDVAEAQGSPRQAIDTAQSAATWMKLLLEKESRPWARWGLGRFHALALMRAAAFMLQEAERDGSLSRVGFLRRFVEAAQPSALEKSLAGCPSAQRDALIAGALDPRVQGIAQNCLGWAYLKEQRYEEALLALQAVQVKYFEDQDWHARALCFLAKTAESASGQAPTAERARYEAIRVGALAQLRRLHPGSRWVKR